MPLPLETWGARPDEIDAPMPGDELIDDPPMSATRAIDLGCSPDEAFGWLTQMGFGRAGWYSYDLIDNLGRRSAMRIHPEWQVTTAGDPIPGGPVDFTASIIDPPDAFVLSLLDRRLAGHRIDFTLAFRLTPLEPERTEPRRSRHPDPTRLAPRGTHRRAARSGAGADCCVSATASWCAASSWACSAVVAPDPESPVRRPSAGPCHDACDGRR